MVRKWSVLSGKQPMRGGGQSKGESMAGMCGEASKRAEKVKEEKRGGEGEGKGSG